MFFVAGRIRPIALIAAVLVFGSFGHAHGLDQQERNRNHGPLVVAQAQTPSNTCARERTACLQAHVREGSFGSRYVPPDEGAECEAAYQACLNPDACTRGRAACLKGAVRRTTTGVEYVPPDDLARCNETYRACTPGGGSATPKSPQPPRPPGRSAAPTGAFQINPGDPQVFNCTIAAGAMRCEGSYALGLARWQYLFEGTLNGTTATGTQSTILDQRYQSGCGYRELMQWPARYEFEDGGRVRVSQSPGTVKLLSNSCPVPPRSVMPSSSSSGVTTWRARQ